MDTRSRLGIAGVVVLAVLVVALGATTAWLIGTRGHPRAGTITVTGTATTRAVPDTLSFQIGVSVRAGSASAALRQSNGRMHSVQGVLLAAGVTRREMRTANVDLYDNTNAAGTVVSFSADDTLSVSTHDLSRAGTILDAAARAAGNEVQLYGVNYSLSSRSSARASARERAVQDARSSALELARATSSSLGRVVSLSARSSAPSVPVLTGTAFNTVAASAPAPLQPGTETVSAQVTIVYALGG